MMAVMVEFKDGNRLFGTLKMVKGKVISNYKFIHTASMKAVPVRPCWNAESGYKEFKYRDITYRFN